MTVIVRNGTFLLVNSNKLNASRLYDSLLKIKYCHQGRDLRQEQDALSIFIDNGFEQVTIPPAYKTKDQKELIDSGKGCLSKLGLKYGEGLYVAHHPYGKNRYPDFLIIINGRILEFEVKSSSTQNPIFSQGDKVVDPSRRDAFYLFTHLSEGTAMLLAEDLITPDNFLLIKQQKLERDVLQAKHDKEFEAKCKGKGEKVYHRTNLAPRGGQEVTDHITRARKENLSEKILYLLKSYE